MRRFKLMLVLVLAYCENWALAAHKDMTPVQRRGRGRERREHLIGFSLGVLERRCVFRRELEAGHCGFQPCMFYRRLIGQFSWRKIITMRSNERISNGDERFRGENRGIFSLMRRMIGGSENEFIYIELQVQNLIYIDCSQIANVCEAERSRQGGDKCRHSRRDVDTMLSVWTNGRNGCKQFPRTHHLHPIFCLGTGRTTVLWLRSSREDDAIDALLYI